jgi:hypothetical protein
LCHAVPYHILMYDNVLYHTLFLLFIKPYAQDNLQSYTHLV